MNWITWATLLVSVTALVASIGAYVVAVRSWRLSQSRSSSALSAKVTEIEEKVVEWLTANRDRAVFDGTSDAATVPVTQVDETKPASGETTEAPSETTPALAETKPPKKKRKSKKSEAEQKLTEDAFAEQLDTNGKPYLPASEWEELDKDGQAEYVDDLANAFEAANSLSPVNKPMAWDSGKQAFGAGTFLEDCPYISGHEQDDWIRGWLSVEKLAKGGA